MSKCENWGGKYSDCVTWGCLWHDIIEMTSKTQIEIFELKETAGGKNSIRVL